MEPIRQSHIKKQKRLFETLGFLTIRLMLVVMIVCYIGRMIAYSILAKFVVRPDGNINIHIWKERIKRVKS